MSQYTPTIYVGDNITTDFTFSWDYIDSDHIHCYLDNVETTSFTLPSTGTVRFDTAPGTGVTIEIRRETPAYPLLVTWNDGSIILGDDLNKAIKQAIYAAEESSLERTVLLNLKGNWSTGVAYNDNDIAENDGSSYVCSVAHTSSASDEPGVGVNWTDYWYLLASKGDTGPSGPGTGDMLIATYDPAGISEQLVGLVATQTLSNKTLNSPSISTPTISSPTVSGTFNTGASYATWQTSGTHALVVKATSATVRLNLADSGSSTDFQVAVGAIGDDFIVWAGGNQRFKVFSGGTAEVAGQQVTTVSNTQTLTNKTLSSPGINLGSDATGDVYYRNGSGVFSRLPIGTTDQVLAVSGGGLPNWVNPASGAWELIGSVAASASSSIEFTGLSTTYAAYRLLGTSIVPGTDQVFAKMRFSDDGGSTWEATNYFYNYIAHYVASAGSTDTMANLTNKAVTELFLSHSFDGGSKTGTFGTATGESGALDLTLYNPAAATTTLFKSVITLLDSFGEPTQYLTNGGHNVASAINGIQFYFSSGNVASGTFKLYGLKAS